MALIAALDEIKALIEAVDGVGPVHIGWPFRADMNDKVVRELFTDATPRINTWVIRRSRTAARDNAPVYRRDRHKILVRAFWAVDSSATSEKDFQAVIEAVRDAFDTHAARRTDVRRIVTPVQVESFVESYFLGKILCWDATLSFEMENF